MPLLSLVPLFGFSHFLHRKAAISSSYALILTISGWLAILFVAAFIGLLWWVSTLIWLTGAALALREAFWLSRQTSPTKDWLPFIVLAVFCALFWLIHHGSQLTYFDEYAHWGIFLKDLWAAEGLWGADSNSVHPRYPPAAPLWQYGFMIFAPRQESTAYFAQFVLMIVPLMAMFQGLRPKHWAWLAIMTLTIVIGLANFGHGIASLYVDHLIATWLAGILLIFMKIRHEHANKLCALALPLVCLTLLKDTGIAFTLAAAGMMAAIVWIEALASKRRFVNATVLATVIVAILVAPSLVSRAAWSANRDAVGVANDKQSIGNIVSGVVRGSQALNDADTNLIGERFKDVFWHQQLSKDAVSAQYNAFSTDMADQYETATRLSTGGFYIAFTLFFGLLLTVLSRRRERLAWSLLATGLLATAISYSLMLYLSYQFAFAERGLILSSYIRYTHSIVLAMFLVSIAALSPATGLVAFKDRDSPKNARLGGSIAAVILLAMFIVETPYLRSFYQKNLEIPQRAQNEALMTALSQSLGKRKLWVYFPNDQPNGFIGHLMQYQLTPTPTTIERSRTFVDHDEDTLARILSEYDVIWLLVSNPNLDQKVAAALSVDLEGRFIEQSAPGEYRIMTFE
ncbi:MAG: hypothetical protein AB8F65_04080 [Woeseiaceae bacterium]